MLICDQGPRRSPSEIASMNTWRRMDADFISISKEVSTVLNSNFDSVVADTGLDYLLPNDEVSNSIA